MPSRVLSIVVIAAGLQPAVALASPAGDDAPDETLVVARDVMPRIAYHALEPTANPIRVQATVFPGTVFHGAMGGLVQHLVGDDELNESVPLLDTGREHGFAPGMAGPIAQGPAQQALGAGGAGRAIGGSIGGAVLRATSGLGARMNQAISTATAGRGGP